MTEEEKETMPIFNPTMPKAPQPTRVFFDPFNSSSTGHQRAENRLSSSTAWRDSRTYKLAAQFRDTTGRGGHQHLSDLVGAGSVDFGKDGRKDNGDWEVGASGLRQEGWQDIGSMLQAASRKRKSEDLDHVGHIDEGQQTNRRKFAKQSLEKDEQKARVFPALASQMSNHVSRSGKQDGLLYKTKKTGVLSQSVKHDKLDEDIVSRGSTPAADGNTDKCATSRASAGKGVTDAEDDPIKQPPQIFRGLTFYLNGSTAPVVSDHKLKQIFTSHGGNASLALGRRTVTHVIIGKTCGGGLASGKLQKEIKTVGGKGIKYVTAQWVLDSVAKGIRLGEGRYMPANVGCRIGGSGQGSVANMFTKDTTKIVAQR